MVLLGIVSVMCSIVFTKLLGQKAEVLHMATYGRCADHFPRVRNFKPTAEQADIVYDSLHAESACDILEWFGTVPLSMLSLFMSATLEGWPAFARRSMNPEAGGNPWFVVLWLIYVYFTNITLWNLITGVIVETVLMLARSDEKSLVEAQKAE